MVELQENKADHGATLILVLCIFSFLSVISTWLSPFTCPQLHDLVILDPLVSPRAKASVAITLGETDKCLTDGADEELQLLSCCARIRRAIVASSLT